MPTYKVTEIRCPDPKCNKLLAANVSCVGVIELYCKGCKQKKVITLS